MLNSTDGKMVLVFSVKKQTNTQKKPNPPHNTKPLGRLNLKVTSAEIAFASGKNQEHNCYLKPWKEDGSVQKRTGYILVRVVLPQFLMAFY